MSDVTISGAALALFAVIVGGLNMALWIVWTVYLTTQAEVIKGLRDRVTELTDERWALLEEAVRKMEGKP